MDTDDIRALRDVSLTIGQLLAKWGQRVRDDIAVPRISRDLAAVGLTTQPGFARGPLSTLVRVVPLPEPGPSAQEKPGSGSGSPDEKPDSGSGSPDEKPGSGSGSPDEKPDSGSPEEKSDLGSGLPDDEPDSGSGPSDGPPDAGVDDRGGAGVAPDGSSRSDPAAAGDGDGCALAVGDGGAAPAQGADETARSPVDASAKPGQPDVARSDVARSDGTAPDGTAPDGAPSDGAPAGAGRRRNRRRKKGGAPGQPRADADDAPPWVAMKVGHLPSATGGVRSVPSGTPLPKATTLMLKLGYSQVPVLDGTSNLRGAVTWRSIATLQGSHRQQTLENATDPDVESVQVTDDLLATLPRVTERGFVVVWRDGRVCGIVTTADLANAYDRLAHPYFLIGEIERRLRRCLGLRFGLEDLRAVNPDATSISNLMFGEYLKLLRPPDQWAKLSWATVDHQQFLRDLDEVRRIRNEIMHFDPRPLTDRQKEHLRQFCGVLKGVDPY
ncbi:CBS domain-containing protein [Pseudofrankia sp. BMG5.36]|uniref:CBS domain-containing protein n=1 Tax=Pseudofrankia sp. BMG5.36 TaxID=1834512 RepID=UPI0008D9D208|nr:CBS domain-containing protein [Pseudofrankia sp. BMG5.36]OHV63235.1 hypothetical protein BCD48_38410 [Pseudofrankia sp. BMG5.36]